MRECVRARVGAGGARAAMRAKLAAKKEPVNSSVGLEGGERESADRCTVLLLRGCRRLPPTSRGPLTQSRRSYSEATTSDDDIENAPDGCRQKLLWNAILRV